MNLQQLLKEKLILVVLNNSITTKSTLEQIEESTLNAWKLDKKRALTPDYIIGLYHGIGISCYKIEGVGIRKADGRVFFSILGMNGIKTDLSNIVNQVDFKAIGIRSGHKEIQYIN